MTRKSSWKGRSVTHFLAYLMQPSFVFVLYLHVIGSPPRRSPGPEISVQFRRIQAQHQDCIPTIRRALFLCLCGRKRQWVGISWGYPFFCRGARSVLWERVWTGSGFQFLQGGFLFFYSWCAWETADGKGWFGPDHMADNSLDRSMPYSTKFSLPVRLKRRANRWFWQDWNTWTSLNKKSVRGLCFFWSWESIMLLCLSRDIVLFRVFLGKRCRYRGLVMPSPIPDEFNLKRSIVQLTDRSWGYQYPRMRLLYL